MRVPYLRLRPRPRAVEPGAWYRVAWFAPVAPGCGPEFGQTDLRVIALPPKPQTLVGYRVAADEISMRVGVVPQRDDRTVVLGPDGGVSGLGAWIERRWWFGPNRYLRDVVREHVRAHRGELLAAAGRVAACLLIDILTRAE